MRNAAHVKFFTPLELMSKPAEAEDDLREKFGGHRGMRSMILFSAPNLEIKGHGSRR